MLLYKNRILMKNIAKMRSKIHHGRKQMTKMLNIDENSTVTVTLYLKKKQ